MSALPSPKVIDRLGALAGMLGSDHAGEQAAAATAATALLRRIGVTWREVIDRAFSIVEDAVADEPSDDLQSVIRECLTSSRITDWEHNFLLSIADNYDCFYELTEKQTAKVEAIIAKVRR